ncbi:MAG: hypothetical protein ACJ74Z_12915 [Bryobacteraceae bacterium]
MAVSAIGTPAILVRSEGDAIDVPFETTGDWNHGGQTTCHAASIEQIESHLVAASPSHVDFCVPRISHL